jgi:hypothetical protein
MNAKLPPSTPPNSRDQRLAKALRDNLNRRKALVRARKVKKSAAEQDSGALSTGEQKAQGDDPGV